MTKRGTILGTVRHRPHWVALAVALYITATYRFTSSTSFANLAITVARSLSDIFADASEGRVRSDELLPSVLLRRELPHLLGDLHAAELGSAHRAEVGGLGAFRRLP